MSDPRPSNPLRNDNKIKLAAFSFNGEGADQKTLVPERFRLSWANCLEIAEEADRGGFEALIPYSRWASLIDDPMHSSGITYETLTWAAAVAARTRHSAVFSTIMMTAYHPVAAAKAMATIDHISNGRFGANLVTGWNPADRRMFGTSGLPREAQYQYADEWLSIIDRLWREHEPFSHRGDYFDVEQAMSLPKPIQARPFLMNAGGSPEGQSFVAKHCDMALVPSQTLEITARHAKAYREKVRNETGREVQIWIQAYVVLRDTVAEAERYVDHYAVDHADNVVIDQMLRIFREKLPPGQALPIETAAMRRGLGASAGGQGLLGNPDDIARKIAAISDCGIDGLLLTWIDYQQGVRDFNREVMPKLVELGLRKQHVMP